jgi:anti-sigma B factor antagonist
MMSLTSSAVSAGGTPGSWQGDPAVVVVTGPLDERTAPRLRARVVELLAEGRHHVVVDLDRVVVVDSTGLGVLIGAARRLQTSGGSLRLVCSSQRVLGTLAVVGLTRILPVYASLAAAVADPGSGARTGRSHAGGSRC